MSLVVEPLAQRRRKHVSKLLLVTFFFASGFSLEKCSNLGSSPKQRRTSVRLSEPKQTNQCLQMLNRACGLPKFEIWAFESTSATLEVSGLSSSVVASPACPSTLTEPTAASAIVPSTSSCSHLRCLPGYFSLECFLSFLCFFSFFAFATHQQNAVSRLGVGSTIF